MEPIKCCYINACVQLNSFKRSIVRYLPLNRPFLYPKPGVEVLKSYGKCRHGFTLKAMDERSFTHEKVRFNAA